MLAMAEQPEKSNQTSIFKLDPHQNSGNLIVVYGALHIPQAFPNMATPVLKMVVSLLLSEEEH